MATVVLKIKADLYEWDDDRGNVHLVCGEDCCFAYETEGGDFTPPIYDCLMKWHQIESTFAYTVPGPLCPLFAGYDGVRFEIIETSIPKILIPSKEYKKAEPIVHFELIKEHGDG